MKYENLLNVWIDPEYREILEVAAAGEVFDHCDLPTLAKMIFLTYIAIRNPGIEWKKPHWRSNGTLSSIELEEMAQLNDDLMSHIASVPKNLRQAAFDGMLAELQRKVLLDASLLYFSWIKKLGVPDTQLAFLEFVKARPDALIRKQDAGVAYQAVTEIIKLADEWSRGILKSEAERISGCVTISQQITRRVDADND